jgi:P-type E1-E2 ATPase
MIEIAVPGRGTHRLNHVVFDANGTLSLDGRLLPGVAERITQLRQVLAVHLLSADTHGKLDEVAAELGIVGTRLHPGDSEVEQKAAYVRALGADSVVAIGNGANDVGMLREAGLGIVVLGSEGTAVEALQAAGVAASTIEVAIDLLLHPKRLVATLRR